MMRTRLLFRSSWAFLLENGLSLLFLLKNKTRQHVTCDDAVPASKQLDSEVASGLRAAVGGEAGARGCPCKQRHVDDLRI